jgi:hypothetical protein
MDKLTTFKDIAIGTKFVKQGQTAVYTKWSDDHAKRSGRTPFPVNPDTKVVPEHDATTNDILASWGTL